jgi:hypothetical protein
MGMTVTPRSASSYTVEIAYRMSRPRRDTFQTSSRSNLCPAASCFIHSYNGRGRALFARPSLLDALMGKVNFWPETVYGPRASGSFSF